MKCGVSGVGLGFRLWDFRVRAWEGKGLLGLGLRVSGASRHIHVGWLKVANCILRLYRGDGEENRNYYSILVLPVILNKANEQTSHFKSHCAEELTLNCKP